MDDKTAKIPSLKEFQNAKSQQEKRAKSKKRNPKATNKHVLKGDTHRVEFNRPGKKSSVNEPEIKTRDVRPERKRKPSTLSGSTQKIDKDIVREQDDRFKAFESNVEYHSRRQNASGSMPLTQTRVAGKRPADRRDVNQGVSTQRPTGQRQPQQRTQGQRPASQSGSSQRAVHRGQNPDRPPLKHNVANTNSAVHRKKKKKPLSPFQRKVRRVLIYSLIVLGFLVVGIILSMTVLFKTENIVVNVPDNFYSSQDIISASGLHYQDNIFMAGKAKAEARLEEKFPYIKSAEVYAVMPDTINIDITLSTPSYAVKTDKLTYIANEDSKVLEVTATADEADVPLIEGVKVKDAKAGEMLEFESVIVRDSLSEMFNLAKEKGYKKITRVDIKTEIANSGTQTLEIRYVYDDRIVVYLGIPENISYKMQTAQTIISEKLDVNGAVLTGELDVSGAYDTKKSYFNQYSLIPEVVITEPASEATEATEPDEYYDGGDYYDDGEVGEDVYW